MHVKINNSGSTVDIADGFVERMDAASRELLTRVIDDLSAEQLEALLRSIGIARGSLQSQLDAMEIVRRNAVLSLTWWDEVPKPYEVAGISPSTWAKWRMEVSGSDTCVDQADYVAAKASRSLKRAIYLDNAAEVLPRVNADMVEAGEALKGWRELAKEVARAAVAYRTSTTDIARWLQVSGGLVRQWFRAKEIRPPAPSMDPTRDKRMRSREHALTYGLSQGVFQRDGSGRKVQRNAVAGGPSGGHGGGRHWLRVDENGFPDKTLVSACGKVHLDLATREDPRTTPRDGIDMACQVAGCREIWEALGEQAPDVAYAARMDDPVTYRPPGLTLPPLPRIEPDPAVVKLQAPGRRRQRSKKPGFMPVKA